MIVTWVFNIFLWLLGLQYPGLQAQLLQNGAAWYSCEAVTAAGYVPSDACVGPVPVSPVLSTSTRRPRSR